MICAICTSDVDVAFREFDGGRYGFDDSKHDERVALKAVVNHGWKR